MDWRLLLGGVLLAVLALPHAQGQNGTEFAGGRRLAVCTSDSVPMSTCTAGDNATFSGYDVEVFKAAAEKLGMEEGKDYAFVCTSYDAAMAAVLRDDGSCDVALGSVTVSTEWEAAGITFSYPIYPSSLAVLVPAKVQEEDGWFFLRPFSLGVWLVIGACLLAVPLLAFAIESLSLKGRVQGKDWRPGLRKSYWEVSWLTMQNGSGAAESSAARILLLAYGVMSLVLISCYTANLTAFLTIQKISSAITSLDQLPGLAVGSTAEYRTRLARNNILPIVFPWDGVQELGQGGPNDWQTELEMGRLAAFIFDEPILRYIDATTGCDLRLLDTTFEPFDYAFAFNNKTTLDLRRLDTAIVTLQEDGTLNTLRSEFIVIPEPVCQIEGGGQTSEDYSITLSQAWGVWVLFAGGVGLSLLVAAVLIPRRRQTMRLRASADGRALEQAASQGASSDRSDFCSQCGKGRPGAEDTAGLEAGLEGSLAAVGGRGGSRCSKAEQLLTEALRLLRETSVDGKAGASVVGI